MWVNVARIGTALGERSSTTSSCSGLCFFFHFCLAKSSGWALATLRPNSASRETPAQLSQQQDDLTKGIVVGCRGGTNLRLRSAPSKFAVDQQNLDRHETNRNAANGKSDFRREVLLIQFLQPRSGTSLKRAGDGAHPALSCVTQCEPIGGE